MKLSNTQQFEQRKQDHIRLALEEKHQSLGQSGLELVQLEHSAFPELDFADIDICNKRFGTPVTKPFFVSSMTAGHPGAMDINYTLAKACQEQDWAMGVGSQRRQLFDKNAKAEWEALIKAVPEVTFYGNLGISQLITTPIDKVKELADSLNAKAMIIHTNPLQEALQEEGTPQFKGGLAALEALCTQLSIPVIVKETGCGFSQQTLQQLDSVGIAAVDISGKGGTHWGRIEGSRSQQHHLQQSAQTFANWGISTVTSLCYAKALNPSYEIFASGGVRNGLDAAKLIALGATAVGLAKPMLEAAIEGEASLIQTMRTFEYELKVALFCSGSKNLAALQEKYHEQQKSI